MIESFWILTGLVSLSSLLYAEYKLNFQLKAISKTIAAISFVGFGYTIGLESDYSYIVFAGLILSFFGDVLLIPKNKKSFLVGIVSFLMGHILYSYAFWGIAVFGRKEIVISLLPILMGVLFYFWVRDRLGNFKIPVIAYLLAIHFMLISAIGMHGDEFLGRETGIALVGALLFYFSDFAVARERFVEKSFWNKAWGLPFYFVGQFLIAYSMKFF